MPVNLLSSCQATSEIPGPSQKQHATLIVLYIFNRSHCYPKDMNDAMITTPRHMGFELTVFCYDASAPAAAVAGWSVGPVLADAACQECFVGISSSLTQTSSGTP